MCVYVWVYSTFCRGTDSFSGEHMARMSFVFTSGPPGSVAGAVPNSSLQGRGRGCCGRYKGIYSM